MFKNNLKTQFSPKHPVGVSINLALLFSYLFEHKIDYTKMRADSNRKYRRNQVLIPSVLHSPHFCIFWLNCFKMLKINKNLKLLFKIVNNYFDIFNKICSRSCKSRICLFFYSRFLWFFVFTASIPTTSKAKSSKLGKTSKKCMLNSRDCNLF